MRSCGRFLATAAVITGLALLAASRWSWRHRQQLLIALVRIVAAAIVAAQLTHAAGCWCRRELLALSDQAARLAAAQPIATLAPITANLAALRAALERLVARLYPVPAPWGRRCVPAAGGASQTGRHGTASA
jgi:predicted permease